MQNRVHPRQRHGDGVVYVDDIGVGVGAAQHLGHQLATLGEVVGERRIALGQLESVDLDFGLANHRHLGHVARRDEPRHCRRRYGAGIAGIDLNGVAPIGHRGQHERAEGLGGLTSHHGRGSLDGLDRLCVGGLAVQDPREHVANFRVGRVGPILQQRPRPKDHGRGRVPRLHRPSSRERGLDRVQLGLVEELDRRYVVPVGLSGQHAIAVDQAAVHQEGRRPGFARVGAVAHADHALGPQYVQQRVVRFAFEFNDSFVEGEGDVHDATSDTARWANVTARCLR